MATTASNDAATASRVSLSPPVRVKRVRWDIEEEGQQTRRVNQQAGGAAAAAPQQEQPQHREEKSLETLLLDDLGSNNVHVLQETLSQLCKLLSDARNAGEHELKKRQAEFLQLGGHAAVIRVMKNHLQNEWIQRNGIGILAIVCYRNQEMKSAVGKARGIQAIVEGMRAHPLARNLITYGIVALCNLSNGNEANATLLVNGLEAMPFIIERMSYFSGDETLTARACYLLDGLCLFAPLRKPILSANAGPALFTAIQTYEGSGTLQKHARAAVSILVTSP